MNTVAPPVTTWRPEYVTDPPVVAEASASGVSWAAVLAGAFVAASLALILMILGVGLGLSSVSPWTGSGASPDGLSSAELLGPQSVFASSGMYLTDALLRGDRSVDANAPTAASTRAELGRILAESMRKGALTDTDRGYAARVVAAQTGLS